MTFETVIWIKKGHSDTVEEKADGIAVKDDTFVFSMEVTNDEEYPWKLIVESPTEKQAFKRGTILTKKYWVGMVRQEYEVRQV